MLIPRNTVLDGPIRGRRFRFARLRLTVIRRLGLIVPLAVALYFSTTNFVTADPSVELFTQGSTSSAGEGYVSLFPQLPFRWSVTTNVGYDDNPDTLPNGHGSPFTQATISLSKDLRNERTQLTMVATGGVVHYFDRQVGPPTDYNGALDLSLRHNLSERLTLGASIYATYQAEPEFGTDLGPTRRGGNYFSMNDIFGARYAWSPRLANYTSYQLSMVKYENELASLAQDRVDHTFTESLRYLWSARTSVMAEYRFELIDYDTAPSDSTTHYILAGLDYQVGARLRASVLGGATARKYTQGNRGRDVRPNCSTAVNYLISPNATLNWTTSYSVEEPDFSETRAGTTYRARTGLEFRYQPKKDLTTFLTLNYYHDENSGSAVPGVNMQGSSQNGFELVANAQYEITERLAWDIRFAHTEVDSAGPYSRNVYTTGLSFSF